MAAFNRGQLDRAAELLTAAATGSGLQEHLARFYAAQAWFAQGVEALKQGRYGEATEHLRSSAELGAAGVVLSRYLVACYVGQGQYAQAAAELEGLLGRDDDEVGVRVRLALSHWRAGRSDRAIQGLEEGVRAHPDDGVLHYHLGTMLAANEDMSGACDALSRAVELVPNWADAHLRLGWCHAAMRQYGRALAHVERAFSLRPTDANIAMQLSLAMQAAEHQQAGSHLHLHLPVASLSRDDAAIGQLTDVVARDPEFVEAFLSLPYADVDQEVFTLLAATLERAIQQHPRYADLYHYCSRVYERLGLRDAAMAASARAVEINPRYISAMVQMGHLFESTDRRQEAIGRLEAALTAGADDANIHYVLGNLYRAEGRVDLARTAYERALCLNAHLSEAREALETLAA